MDEPTTRADDAKRQMLRHTVATLAYRGGKAVTGVPEDFSAFRAGETVRTPGEILAHICDLMDWVLSSASGTPAWRDSAPLEWEKDVSRFFITIEKFDAYLASDAPLGFTAERLFQGAIADALTHVGQINILRRMAGVPVRGENYFKAEIVVGRVGADQSTKRLEFD